MASKALEGNNEGAPLYAGQMARPHHRHDPRPPRPLPLPLPVAGGRGLAHHLGDVLDGLRQVLVALLDEHLGQEVGEGGGGLVIRGAASTGRRSVLVALLDEHLIMRRGSGARNRKSERGR